MKKSSKQDRQGVRTPADLERKYNLSNVSGGVSSAQIAELNAQFTQKIAALLGAIQNLKDGKANTSGWEPDKYIGTDTDGNLIEKDPPSAEGGYELTDEDVAMIVDAVLDALPNGDEVSY